MPILKDVILPTHRCVGSKKLLTTGKKGLVNAGEDPGFALAYYGQANASLSFAEFQHSLDAATEQSAGISDGERMLIDISRSFLSNDAAAGLALAGELVEKYPGSARSWIVLAGMQANQNDNVGARASNEKALELENNAPGALAGLASNNLFGEPKDFTAAEAWANKLIAAYPDEAKGFEILGDIKRAQNNLEAALEAYNSASKIDPTLELAAHKRGHVNSFLGNIEDARAAYDEAIAIAPPESKASYAVYKGFTHIHGGDIPAAIDELEALADHVGPMGTPEDQVKGLQVFALNSAAFAAMHAGLFDRAASISIQWASPWRGKTLQHARARYPARLNRGGRKAPSLSSVCRSVFTQSDGGRFSHLRPVIAGNRLAIGRAHEIAIVYGFRH